MRVLFIVSAYPRWAGDVITPWLGESIERLRASGVDVEVLAPAFRGGSTQMIDGVVVHRFRYAPREWETLSHDAPIPAQLRERPMRFALVPGYLASASSKAMSLAKRGRFDVVHAFWPFPHALPGIAARLASDAALVSTFFGAEIHWLPARHWWARKAVAAIVRQSDATTAISHFAARELRAIAPGAEPAIIPFGAAVAPRESTAICRDAYSSGGPAELLFVGRLVKRKGVGVLLRALALLAEREARLTIVGDGAERAALESLAASLGVAGRTTFTGQISAEQLDAHFRACDAAVLPAVNDALSGTEGLGVALIEALAYARPVIASDVGGIPDIVRDGETGLLVPPGDPLALAAAARALAANPERARSLGEAGREHVTRQFSWTRVVRDLTAVYERAIEVRRARR